MREPRNSRSGRPDIALRWGARLTLAALLLIITDLALAPGPVLPDLILSQDKLEHFLAFAVLAVLARPAFPGLAQPFAIAGLAFYGGGIEFAQSLEAIGRTASVYDFIADLLGLTAGWLAGRGLAALRPSPPGS